MRAFVRKLPPWIKTPLQRARDIALYSGNARLCPVCEKSSRRFRPAGLVPRQDAQCIRCGALERDRFLWLFLQKRTNLFDGRKKAMLHIAPEGAFEPRFREHLKEDYLTADLHNPGAMVKMDICNIQYENQTFDVIYCSHVLEHVVDDRIAMRELFRVLKKDGWAILLVPILRETTYEDPSIIDPAQRLAAFGQEDHVRIYGRDYRERLREAGFNVEVVKVSDMFNSEEAEAMGLTPAAGEAFYCTKPT